MDQEILESFKDKKIRIHCKNGFVYICQVLETANTSFLISDKHEQMVSLNYEDIETIKELKEERR